MSAMEKENYNGPGPDQPLMKAGRGDQAQAVNEQQQNVAYRREIDEVEVRVPPKFIGLTKEELSRYADDPFWRNLRLILFILFWVAWIAMFAGAIAIVVTSPKCPPKPNREWWQKKFCYQIWTRSFKDSDGNGLGDVNGISDSLSKLKSLGVQTIWVSPLVASDDNNGIGIVDYQSVDPRYGNNEDLKNLVEAAHSQDMFVLMDFPAAVTSINHPWFRDSSTKQAVYDDFYIWKPNSFNGKFFGTHPGRPEVYMHLPDNTSHAVLNWQSNNLQTELQKVFEFWLDQGIDGFYIEFSEYLAPLTGDSVAVNWDQTNQILVTIEGWAEAFQNKSGRDVYLFASPKGEPEQLKARLLQSGGVDAVINNDLAAADDTWGNEKFHQTLGDAIAAHDAYNETWPLWEVGSPLVSRIATRLGGPERAELAQMLMMMLPGSAITYYGDELGMVDAKPGSWPDLERYRASMQWDNITYGGFSTAPPRVPFNVDQYQTINYASLSGKGVRGPLYTYKTLAKLRFSDDALLFGNVTLAPITSALIIQRAHDLAINTYLAILNFGKNSVTVSVPGNFTGPSEATFVVASSNMMTRKEFNTRQTIDLTNLELEPSEGIVVKYKDA